MKAAYALLFLAGCGGAGERLPPAPLPELGWAAPAPGMSWIAGHWHWDELRREASSDAADPCSAAPSWVWVPGHWQ